MIPNNLLWKSTITNKTLMNRSAYRMKMSNNNGILNSKLKYHKYLIHKRRTMNLINN